MAHLPVATPPHQPPDGTFSLSVVPDRDRVYVRPTGEVDLSTAGTIEDAACDLLDRGFSSVVIDLRGVTFLDCTGVHALLSADRQGRSLNRRVSIIPGGARVQRILDLTGVLDRLELEPSPALSSARLERLLACASDGDSGITGRQASARRPGSRDGRDRVRGNRSQPAR